MIHENATVVDVRPDALVVETIQQSTCGSCAARKGCGQGVLAKYLSSSSYFHIALDGESPVSSTYRVGDSVTIAMDELALVRASMWLYLMPIMGFLLGAVLGNTLSELASIIGALAGLVIAAGLSKYRANRVADDPRYSPVLVTDDQVVRFVTPSLQPE